METRRQMAERCRVSLCHLTEKNQARAAELAKRYSVPLPQTANGSLQGLYHSGDTDLLYAFEGVTGAERLDYLAGLATDGFCSVSSSQIGENRFCTLQKGESVLSVSYFSAYRALHVLYSETATHLPPQLPALGGNAEPMMLQPGRRGASDAAPGMSYLFRLIDGSWVVIDGGPWNAADGEDLWRILRDGKDEAPVISLWMFSHYHGDHVGLAYEFLKQHLGELDLRAVGYNFPNAETLQLSREPFEPGWMTYLPNLIAEQYPQAAHWRFRSGERLSLPGAEIEILFTHEDNFPTELQWGNDTSSAWTVTQGERKYLFLGDCDPMQCCFLSDVYGESLKCDILQLTHHGFNGATEELYRLADPEICLWACDGERFARDGRCLGIKARSNDRGYSYTETVQPEEIWEDYRFNHWLRDASVRERIHYHASEEIMIPWQKNGSR